ncbi:MAG TPA: cupin domain-containing protein [Flavobacteriaceae bacterium]|nr:cupin domain-containing protein [Flavobacteriaceae bacterium]
MKLYSNTLILTLCAICLFLVSCNTNTKTETEYIKLLETTKSWNGATLPKYPEGQPKITILKAVIPPHTQLDVHKHNVINAAVMLDGELTVVTEAKDTLHVKAGDAFEEVVNTWHHGINNSAKPASLIIFYAGTKGGTNTILK